MKALMNCTEAAEWAEPPLSNRPTALLPIHDRPLFDYWLRKLVRLGIREIAVNTRSHGDQLRSYIKDVNRRGTLHLSEFCRSESIEMSNSFFADGMHEVLVIRSEQLSAVDLSLFVDYHRSHGGGATALLVDPNRAEERSSSAHIRHHGRLRELGPELRDAQGRLVSGGLYVIDRNVFDSVDDFIAVDLEKGVRLELFDTMFGCSCPGRHSEINSLETYTRAGNRAAKLFAAMGYGQDGSMPCVFFDRDGTLIEFEHYLSEPSQVRLMPDSAATIKGLQQLGFACVVVTNQSIVGRKKISLEQLGKVNDRMCSLLHAEGAVLDGIFVSTEVPSQGSSRMEVEFLDRKPGPGLLLQAAKNLGLDLSQSWMVGDMVSDVLAGQNAGCRGQIWIAKGKPPNADEAAVLESFPKATSLLECMAIIGNSN